MILYVSQEYYGEAVPIPFPATMEQVRDELGGLDTGSQPLFIRGSGPVWHFEDRLDQADLVQETGVQKLNQLANLVDAMDLAAQKVFAGALRAESINGLDDILEVASSLSRYEFIEGVTTDKELGGWLVEHGMTGVDFPEAVRPYLDYAGIGAAYYADHGGAYTANGYVKRREPEQTQKEDEKAQFALTLVSPTASHRICLPASDEQMEAAKRALRLDSLENAVIDDVKIDYPWAHMLPMDGITLEDANTLAECVQAMSACELRVFSAALEVEAPCSFHEASTIAMDIDDYELVPSNEGEYGREALRYAGACDEILEILDGFTDFDALGRFEMEQDGVRETSCGSIKRLSAPFPQSDREIGQTMC